MLRPRRDSGPSATTAGGTHSGGHQAVTENPSRGDTETWEFYNATADAHPIHIHETVFQVVDRQAIVVEEDEHEGAHEEDGGRVYLVPGWSPAP